MNLDVIVERASWLLKGSSEVAYITDPQGSIEYVNPAFEALTGFHADDALGHTPTLVKSGYQSAEFYRTLWDTLRQGREFNGVLVNRRRDGTLFHEEKTIRPLFDEAGGIAHFLSCGRDVSQRVLEQDQLRHDATHDLLTGLPGRPLFVDRVERAAAHAERSGESFAVALADFDGFKSINDRFGHGLGDAALQEAARRLERCVRGSDTVARWGGGEFVLLLQDTDDATRVLASIAQAGAAPLIVDDQDLGPLRMSIGVSRYPGGGRDAMALLRSADAAMYEAKRAGGGQHRWSHERAGLVDLPPHAGIEIAGAPLSDALLRLDGKVPMSRRLLHRGEAIYRAGQPFRELHIIRLGSCKLMSVTIDGHEELNAMLFKGDWLGFDGLADGRHRSSAVAADVTEVWSFRYEALMRAGAQHPELLAAMHAAMALQTTRERDAVLAMHSLSADGRVAAFLCRWADKLDQCGMRNDEISLSATRAEIGAHLGLRLESVSRAMTLLERERLIRLEPGSRRSVAIPDLPALRRFVARLSTCDR